MLGHNHLRRFLVPFTIYVLAVPHLSFFGPVQWAHAVFFHHLVWSLPKHCVQLALELAHEAALQFLLVLSFSVFWKKST